MYMKPIFAACVLWCIPFSFAHAQSVRFMLHGNMSHELPTEEYLRFVEEARPDILIMGVFDQRLYALAAPSAKSKKPPLNPDEHLAKWKAVADRLHRKGIRLIGQTELFVVSDQPTELDDGVSWFGFYDKHWNDKLLGPRPTKSVRDLLSHSVLDEHEKVDKTAQCGCRVNTKAILGCVTGTYRVHETAPNALHLEKLHFMKQRVRTFFEDVYLKHGRALKKNLFAAQWNHMAYFDELHLDRGHLPTSTRTSLAHAIADERWGVPASLWGRGESLIWYCNWGTTQNTILAKEYAGDTVLYGLYLRARARGKPYVINKYDFYRPRVMMAEAAALGYATNAIATPWQHEDDRAVVVRYFRFLRQHEDLYLNATRQAEIGLLFPSRAIAAGDASALEYVEACGRTMIREHLLFDMIPDDLLTQTPLGNFRTLIVAAPEYLQADERDALRKFAKGGGKLVWTPISAADRERAGVTSKHVKHPQADWLKPTLRIENARTDTEGVRAAITKFDSWSHAVAPWTVEMHAYRQEAKKRWIVHLVNYNHREKAPGKSVSAREAPISAEPVSVRLQLPAGKKVQRVRFLSPDDADGKQLPFRLDKGTLTFTAPSFLAYGVCIVEAD